MRSLLALSALVLAATAAAPASAQLLGRGSAGGTALYGPPDVRLWVDGERDLFSPGDPVRLRFRTSQDAYIAVLHVATDGTLEVLFPTSPWEESLVAGQRVYSLPGTGAHARFTMTGTPGIGYFYIVASAEPLDFRAVSTGRRWDFGQVGRSVRGDPFLALDELTRRLVRDWEYTPFSVDYYSYYIGDRYRYPSYACYDRRWNSPWSYSYGRPCDQVVLLLRDHPDYYDTRLYRRSRGVYYRPQERRQPAHGYKERPDAPASVGRPRAVTPSTESGARPAPPAERGTQRSEPVVRPERRRPELERRPPERTSAPAARPEPARPAPRPEPRAEPPRREPDPSATETARPSSRRPGT